MMATVPLSSSSLLPLLESLEDNTAGQPEQTDAYLTIANRLNGDEGRQFLPAVVKHFSRLGNTFQTHISSQNAELSQAALQALGFCVFHAHVVSAIPATFADNLLSSLSSLVVNSTDKNTCTRALWVISKQNFPPEVVAKKVPEILRTLECLQMREDIQSVVIEHESLNVIVRLLEQAPIQMGEAALKWAKLVIPLVVHSASKVRLRAAGALEMGLPLLLEKQKEVAAIIEPLMSSKLIPELQKMFSTKNETNVLKLWPLFVRLLGKLLHRGGPFINSLLGLEELGFRSSSPNIKKIAYIAWKSLIDNFALNPEILCSAKRLKLLMQPLSSIHVRTEALLLTKLEVWWYLVVRLGPNLPAHFEQVGVPLLQCTLGPDLSSPGTPARSSGQSSVAPNSTPKSAGAPSFSSPVTPRLNLNSSVVTGQAYPSIQLLGLEMLLHYFLGPEITTAAKNKLTLSLEPLVHPFLSSPASFNKHAFLLISAVRDSFICIGKEAPEVLLTLIWKNLVSFVSTTIDAAGHKKERQGSEVLTWLLQALQSIVSSEALSPHKALCLLQLTVKGIPPRVLGSASYQVGKMDVLNGTPALFLVTLFYTSSQLAEFVEDERFFLCLETLVSCGLSGPTSPLAFGEAVLGVVGRAATALGNKEQLWRIWSVVVNPLTDTITQTNEVNQGDALEHNFSAVHTALMFPVTHLLPGNALSPMTQKSMLATWSRLYKVFARCSALVATAEENVCCEELCAKMAAVLDQKTLKIPSTLESVANILLVIIENADFSPYTPQFQQKTKSPHTPLTWVRKKSRALGNLSTFQTLLLLSLETFTTSDVSDTVLDGTGPALVSILSSLFSNLALGTAIQVALASLTQPLAALFKQAGRPPSEQPKFILCLETKLQKLLGDVLGCLQTRSALAYDDDLLCLLSPLLCVLFLHRIKHFRSLVTQFWNATFANAMILAYPEDLRPVLSQVKQNTPILLPGFQSVDVPDELSGQYSSESSQLETMLSGVQVTPGVKRDSLLTRAGVAKDRNSKISIKPVSTKLDFGSPKPPRREALEEEASIDFVFIPPETKERVLTEHQKEVKRSKRIDIPAMYNNLDASLDTTAFTQYTQSQEESLDKLGADEQPDDSAKDQVTSEILEVENMEVGDDTSEILATDTQEYTSPPALTKDAAELPNEKPADELLPESADGSTDDTNEDIPMEQQAMESTENYTSPNVSGSSDIVSGTPQKPSSRRQSFITLEKYAEGKPASPANVVNFTGPLTGTSNSQETEHFSQEPIVENKTDTGQDAVEETGDCAAAEETGDCAVQEETGERVAPEETGEQAALEETGECAAPEETGERAAPEETGECAAPEETGECAAPEKTGERAAPEETGERAAPEETGERAAPEETGECAAPEETGECAAPEKTGEHAAPEETGERVAPEETGECAAPEKTGERTAPEETGELAVLEETGERAAQETEQAKQQSSSNESSQKEEEEPSGIQKETEIEKAAEKRPTETIEDEDDVIPDTQTLVEERKQDPAEVIENSQEEEESEKLLEDSPSSQSNSSQGEPRRSGRRRSRPLRPGEEADELDEKKKSQHKDLTSLTNSPKSTPSPASQNNSQSQGRASRRSKVTIEVEEDVGRDRLRTRSQRELIVPRQSNSQVATPSPAGNGNSPSQGTRVSSRRSNKLAKESEELVKDKPKRRSIAEEQLRQTGSKTDTSFDTDSQSKTRPTQRSKLVVEDDGSQKIRANSAQKDDVATASQLQSQSPGRARRSKVVSDSEEFDLVDKFGKKVPTVEEVSQIVTKSPVAETVDGQSLGKTIGSSNLVSESEDKEEVKTNVGMEDKLSQRSILSAIPTDSLSQGSLSSKRKLSEEAEIKCPDVVIDSTGGPVISQADGQVVTSTNQVVSQSRQRGRPSKRTKILEKVSSSPKTNPTMEVEDQSGSPGSSQGSRRTTRLRASLGFVSDVLETSDVQKHKKSSKKPKSSEALPVDLASVSSGEPGADQEAFMDSSETTQKSDLTKALDVEVPMDVVDEEVLGSSLPLITNTEVGQRDAETELVDMEGGSIVKATNPVLEEANGDNAKPSQLIASSVELDKSISILKTQSSQEGDLECDSPTRLENKLQTASDTVKYPPYSSENNDVIEDDSVFLEQNQLCTPPNAVGLPESTQPSEAAEEKLSQSLQASESSQKDAEVVPKPLAMSNEEIMEDQDKDMVEDKENRPPEDINILEEDQSKAVVVDFDRSLGQARPECSNALQEEEQQQVEVNDVNKSLGQAQTKSINGLQSEEKQEVVVNDVNKSLGQAQPESINGLQSEEKQEVNDVDKSLRQAQPESPSASDQQKEQCITIKEVLTESKMAFTETGTDNTEPQADDIPDNTPLQESAESNNATEPEIEDQGEETQIENNDVGLCPVDSNAPQTKTNTEPVLLPDPCTSKDMCHDSPPKQKGLEGVMGLELGQSPSSGKTRGVWSPSASPSTSILKKGQKRPMEEESPSPFNKCRRVSFADPIQHQELADDIDRRSPVIRTSSPRAKTNSSIPQPKFITTPTKALLTLSPRNLCSPGYKSSKKCLISEMGQEPRPIPKDCVYPALVSCSTPVEAVLPQIISNMWPRGFGQLVRARNIKTVGDLSALTPSEIKNLPIRSPKISNVKKALKTYHEQQRKGRCDELKSFDEMEKMTSEQEEPSLPQNQEEEEDKVPAEALATEMLDDPVPMQQDKSPEEKPDQNGPDDQQTEGGLLSTVEALERRLAGEELSLCSPDQLLQLHDHLGAMMRTVVVQLQSRLLGQSKDSGP